MSSAVTACATFAGVWLVSAALTMVVRNYAIGMGMLDHPNARSSHAHSTPRGGGLAVVVVVAAVALILALQGWLPGRAALSWILGGGLVAAIGFIDDRHGLSARTRFITHLLAAMLVVWAAGGLPPMPWFSGTTDLGIAGAVFATLGVVWLINLFNFMDGTDGIAATQAVFVVGSGAALALTNGSLTPSAIMALATAAASLGFLVWNWPPARIFMGDVGSGFLGLALVICALQTSWDGSINLWTWIVLHALFVADSTVTLLVRLGRGERVYEAHRQHAYQRLSRRWNSHGKVLLLFSAINLCWLLPIAIATVRHPDYGLFLMLLAMIPLCAGAFLVGAGRNR